MGPKKDEEHCVYMLKSEVGNDVKQTALKAELENIAGDAILRVKAIGGLWFVYVKWNRSVELLSTNGLKLNEHEVRVYKGNFEEARKNYAGGLHPGLTENDFHADSEEEDDTKAHNARVLHIYQGEVKPEHKEAVDYWLAKSGSHLTKHKHFIKIKCMEPFLFGKDLYQTKHWIEKAVDVKLLSDAHSFTLGVLEDHYFCMVDIMDEVVDQCFKDLGCKRERLLAAFQILRFYESGHILDNGGILAHQAKRQGLVIDITQAVLKTTKVTQWKWCNEIDDLAVVIALLMVFHQFTTYIKDFWESKKNPFESLDADIKALEQQSSVDKDAGNEDFKLNNYEKAVCKYTKAIHLNNLSYTLYSNRAMAYLKTHRYKPALCDARRSLVLKHDWHKAHYRYIEAARNLGEIEKARYHSKLARSIVSTEELEIQAQELQDINPQEQNKSSADEAPDADDVPALVTDSEDSANEDEKDSRSDDGKAQVEKTLNEIKQKRQKEQEKRTKKEEKQKKQEVKRQEDIHAEDKRKEEDEVNEHLRRGSEQLLSSTNSSARRQALDSYKTAHELMMQEKNKQFFDAMSFSVLLYATGTAHVEIGTVKEVQEGVVCFKSILQEGETAPPGFPVVYYGLGRALCKQHRYQDAMVPLQRGLAVVDTCDKVYKWPGTEILIEESRAEKLKSVLEEFLEDCNFPEIPHAQCRYAHCSESKPAIYTDEPDFKGYVQVFCLSLCRIDYHTACWKKLKSSAEPKLSDRSILSGLCLTPDCGAHVDKIIIIDDRQEKKEFDNDHNHIIDQPVKEKKPKTKLAPSARNAAIQLKKKEKKKVEKAKKLKEKAEAAAEAEPDNKKGDQKEEEDNTKEKKPLTEEATQQPKYATVLRTKHDDDDMFKSKAAQQSKAVKKKKEKVTNTIDVGFHFAHDQDRMLMGQGNVDEDGDVIIARPVPVDGGAFKFTYTGQANGTGTWNQDSTPFAKPEEPLCSDIAEFEERYNQQRVHLTAAHNTAPIDPETQSMEETVYSIFAVLLKQTGPLPEDSERIVTYLQEIDPNTIRLINEAGGIATFLHKSENFLKVDKYVCLKEDANRARRLAENDKQLKPTPVYAAGNIIESLPYPPPTSSPPKPTNSVAGLCEFEPVPGDKTVSQNTQFKKKLSQNSNSSYIDIKDQFKKAVHERAREPSIDGNAAVPLTESEVYKTENERRTNASPARSSESIAGSSSHQRRVSRSDSSVTGSENDLDTRGIRNMEGQSQQSQSSTNSKQDSRVPPPAIPNFPSAAVPPTPAIPNFSAAAVPPPPAIPTFHCATVPPRAAIPSLSAFGSLAAQNSTAGQQRKSRMDDIDDFEFDVIKSCSSSSSSSSSSSGGSVMAPVQPPMSITQIDSRLNPATLPFSSTASSTYGAMSSSKDAGYKPTPIGTGSRADSPASTSSLPVTKSPVKEKLTISKPSTFGPDSVHAPEFNPKSFPTAKYNPSIPPPGYSQSTSVPPPGFNPSTVAPDFDAQKTTWSNGDSIVCQTPWNCNVWADTATSTSQQSSSMMNQNRGLTEQWVHTQQNKPESKDAACLTEPMKELDTLRQLTLTYNDIRQERDQLLNVRNSNEVEMRTLRGQVDQYYRECQNMRSELDKANAALNDERATFAERRQLMQEEMQQLQQECHHAKHTEQELRDELNASQKYAIECMSKQKKAEENLQDVFNDAQRQRDSATSEISSLTQSRFEAMHALNEAKAELQREKQKNNELLRRLHAPPPPPPPQSANRAQPWLAGGEPPSSSAGLSNIPGPSFNPQPSRTNNHSPFNPNNPYLSFDPPTSRTNNPSPFTIPSTPSTVPPPASLPPGFGIKIGPPPSTSSTTASKFSSLRGGPSSSILPPSSGISGGGEVDLEKFKAFRPRPRGASGVREEGEWITKKKKQFAAVAAATPAPAAGGATRGATAGAAAAAGGQTKPNNHFAHVKSRLQDIFPDLSSDEIGIYITDFRAAKMGRLTGMKVEEIINNVKANIHQNRKQPSAWSQAGRGGGTAGLSEIHTAGIGGNGGNGGNRGEEIYEEEHDPCIICHDEIGNNRRQLDCGHEFDDHCIRKWFREQNTCPTCRQYTVLDDEFPALQ